MTREEAVKVIENRDSIMDYCESAQLGEALEMAIKALEQEPCDDAISRQALLAYIEFILTHGMGKKKSFEFIKKYVERQPSVTPKQKMGHWIKISPAGIYECSECGQNVMTGDIDAYRHCYGCGVKMSENPTGSNCTACILDGTDACSRGAGRAVDGRVCEDFVGESED